LTRSSALLAVKVLIPFGKQEFLPRHYDIPNPVQFNVRKPMVPGEGDGGQPEFAGGAAFIDVHMGRLSRFVTIEIELKSLFAQDRRHPSRL
jgi:hypothetical protein